MAIILEDENERETATSTRLIVNYCHLKSRSIGYVC